MRSQRWLRIIPVALVMYTISYVDRTNISLALEPRISTLMHDLLMDDRMKGAAAGIFFLGYVLLQAPGGFLANRWSARKVVSVCLAFWGIAAAGCGLTRTFGEFGAMRFCLGMAESGVFPATTVLLANWFPRQERARATAYWCLCQPLAVVVSAPFTGWLLQVSDWRTMLVLEGLLPLVWLPVWWLCISDHPREARWISAEEKDFVQQKLDKEAAELDGTAGSTRVSLGSVLRQPMIYVMILMNFLHNSQAYGCMTFFTSAMSGRKFNGLQHGLLFAGPYAVTALIMVLNSWHSDRTGERRGHVAAVYALSGVSLVGSVLCREHFWLSYGLMCLAIPGPFAALAPFWAIPTETLPRTLAGVVIGMANACGNLGGFAGPYIVGWLAEKHGGVAVPFSALGVGMLAAAALAFLLPRSRGAEATS
jgi:sugar phosphate permease